MHEYEEEDKYHAKNATEEINVVHGNVENNECDEENQMERNKNTKEGTEIVHEKNIGSY